MQDDAHIFCLPSQLTAEIKGTLDLVQRTMAAFGFTQLEVRVVLYLPGWASLQVWRLFVAAAAYRPTTWLAFRQLDKRNKRKHWHNLQAGREVAQL